MPAPNETNRHQFRYGLLRTVKVLKNLIFTVFYDDVFVHCV